MKKLLLLITLFTFYTQITQTQWYRQTVPVTNTIKGIEFVDSLRGWACTGNTGTPDSCYILTTSNGGINWVVQFGYENSNFYALDMIDANTGYAAGWRFTPNDGFVFKTTNGGVNWFNLNAAIGRDADDIFFVNADTGYLCADFSINVYKTTNGGANWFLSNNGITQHPYRLFFLNNNTGYCGADFTLYKTTNAGTNWVNIFNSADGVSSIFFLNESTGWLGFFGDKIRFTSNGGVNWILQSNPGYGTVTDIFFYNQNIGWAGTSAIYVYKTTNSGLNWGYQRDSTGAQNICFIDSSRGWSGDAGVSRTINGGGLITYVGIINVSNEIPRDFKLYQNYPNPFNPRTNIKYQITKTAYVNITIYDILGRNIETLVNENQNAGTYLVDWNAEKCPSGVYYYSIITENYTETRKMILIK